MNEVTELYENCNIKPKQKGYCDWDSNCPYPHHKCNDECPYWKYEDEAKYPPFTAEKQLEICKFLLKVEHSISYYFYENRYGFVIDDKQDECIEAKEFETALAMIVNNLWQDLTDAERAEIKNILETEVRE